VYQLSWATARWKWRQELRGSWIFESRDDGAILFYPHGWGRAYAVPTERKRREIEKFLALWRAKLLFTMHLSLWIMLPLAVLLLATVIPPISRVVWYIPLWHAISRSALGVIALGCLLFVGSPLALRFLAETAKADLEKAEARRSFVESIKDYARQSNWSLLWFEAAFGSYYLVGGVWRLRPQRETVMRAARINPHFLAVGVMMIVLGGFMALAALWQIRIKLSSDGSGATRTARPKRS
jgi:hypothetical protein